MRVYIILCFIEHDLCWEIGFTWSILLCQGYRVLVVEQTETPTQLDLRRKEEGSKDKVWTTHVFLLDWVLS